MTKRRSLQSEWVKVWPLKHGLKGWDAMGHDIDLLPGRPGWMSPEDAQAAVKSGKGQLMAGASTASLKTPSMEAQQNEPEENDEPTHKSRKGRYSRKDMRAEDMTDTQLDPQD